MTDTTNHAEVIRKALLRSDIDNLDYETAVDALDALTRELEDAKEDARLWHESEKACSTQFDKLLDENRAQSARIATLEAELADAQTAERERIIHIAQDIYTENAGHPSYGRHFARKLRAALAPKEAQG